MRIFPALIAWPEEPPPHPDDAARYDAFMKETRLRVARRRLREAHEIRDGRRRHRAVKRRRDILRRLMKKEAA